MINARDLSSDLIAGFVVFLIAVPLCLGIALASGAPLFSGMVTGIVGGIVVGCLSKSRVSVCGPAAGLTAIVLDGITSIGAFEGFLIAVVLAGIFQIILGIFKAGSIAYYFPSNVIKGMLCAIGIIIILKQFNHFVGYDAYSEGDMNFKMPDGENTFSAILHSFNFIHPGVLLTGILSLLSMILWDHYKPKSLRLIPGAILAVGIGIISNYIYKFNGLSKLIIEQTHLVTLPQPESIAAFLDNLIFPDFSYFTNPKVWFVALTIAIVASIETLLTIEATDKIDPEKSVTPTNRELWAQGVGNMICGFLGGLPLTSVIVRSSANINAGAKTKKASIFHGMILLIGVLFLPKFLSLIPLTSLAAILLITGYKLASPALFAKMFSSSKNQWVPFIVTVVAVVFTDLLTGVLVGMGVGLSAVLTENLRNTYYFHKDKYKDGDLIHIVLAQEVSFLNKAAICITLDNLPANSYVLIDAIHTSYMDHDVQEIIREFSQEKAKLRGIQVILRGFKEKYKIENNDHIFFESVNDYPAIKSINNGITSKEALETVFKEEGAYQPKGKKI